MACETTQHACLLREISPSGIGIHYVHIDPCQLRNCNYVIGEYACAKYLGVGKNDCVNTKQERVIVNTKRKQVIMRGKLFQFKVIQINFLSSGGSWIIDPSIRLTSLPRCYGSVMAAFDVPGPSDGGSLIVKYCSFGKSRP